MMNSLRIFQPLVLSLVGVMLLSACDTDEPAVEEKYNQYELLSTVGPLADSPDAILAGTLSLIEDARSRVWVAFEDLTEESVANALLAAHARGVDVRVVGDLDARSQAGFRLLDDELVILNDLPEGNESLPVPGSIRYADGFTIQTPEPGTDIPRPGSLNRMTHNFVIIDDITVINMTGGYPSDWRNTLQIGFIASSQDMARDFEDEFRQLASGVDSTTPTAFNGPLKSIADGRFLYPGNIAEFELYFGPQERTAKRVVDHLFGAKSSIWIATEQLSNDFVCKALIYKMRTAFDVRLVLKEPIDVSTTTGTSSCRELEAEFEADNPTQPGYRHELRIEPDLAANLVVIDELESRNEPADQTLVYVMSQPFLAALTFDEGDIGDLPIPLAADTFADANVWLIREFSGHPEPAVDELAERFTEIFEGAEQ